MKRYLLLLLICSPALAQTPEMVTQSTAPTTPTTTIVTTGPVIIGSTACKEPAHLHAKIIRKSIKDKHK